MLDPHALIGPSPLQAAGRMSSAALSSEPWRCVTALTLHADAEHLASNALGLGAFGLLLSRRTGLGVSVCIAVLGGAVGNALDAALVAPTTPWHGASTAVFALSGACACVFRSFLLLLMTILLVIGSHAANVETGSHALGAVAGFALGLLFEGSRPEPAGALAQLGAAVAGFAIVATSWSLAL